VYLPYTVDVNPETGVLVLDRDGKPQVRTAALLLRWKVVEYLELRPFNPWP
jgi:hypothetical protein